MCVQNLLHSIGRVARFVIAPAILLITDELVQVRQQWLGIG